MDSWSTESVNARERLAYWREIVCNSLYPISPEASDERFSARMKARNTGMIRFAKCESTSYELVRTQRDVRRGPTNHYIVWLQLRGRTLIDQGSESFAFGRNDIAILDGRHPFRASMVDDGALRRQATIMLPHAMLDSRAPWLRTRPAYKLDTKCSFVDLARTHFRHLIDDDLNDVGVNLLADNLCNLLVLAIAPNIPPGTLQPELQLTAILAFCRQNLHDHRLSPRFVAAHFNISVRTLHLRFATLRRTFSRWLRENRLEAASQALKNPCGQMRSISEIAYRVGFNDLSHFNKSFRAQFGMTPGEWRHDFQRGQ